MIKSLYDKFMPWSSKGSIWLISDTHFGSSHKGWLSPSEQLAIINKKVHKNDTLVHLGDVGDFEYIKQIKSSNKILIMGNHDTSVTLAQEYFDEVYSGPVFIAKKLLLSHEPLIIPFALNIHGHIHGDTRVYHKGHINLASDVAGFTPISLSEIIKKGCMSKITDIHRNVINNKI